MPGQKRSSNKPKSQDDGLDTSIQFVKGVGPKLAERFKAIGVETVRGLLWHVPHTYQDQRVVTPLKEVRPGQVSTVRGIVTSIHSRRPRGRSRVREIITATIDDGEVGAQVVWFNQSYVMRQIKRGVGLQLHGKAEVYDFGLQFSSPEFTVLDPTDLEQPGEILPIYPSTKGLPQRTIRRTVSYVLARMVEDVRDLVPTSVREKRVLPPIKTAWRILHQPGPDDGVPTEHVPQAVEDGDITLFDTIDEDVFLRRMEEASKRKRDIPYERARQRLAYEEFLVMQALLARARRSIRDLEGIPHALPDPDPLAPGFDPASVMPSTEIQPQRWPAEYLGSLPFTLTGDQRRVIEELQKDLHLPRPVNRLLQGDVGSGKTVVALYLMLVVAAGGGQAALMAPTEILAQQHHATIRNLTKSLRGLNCGLLSGSASVSERRELQTALQSGAVQILVGTHALFEDPVTFENLGLVVVDEQHRFGVEQRRRLLSKGRHPDLLLMTATPIPRTLALSWYGDMDTSTIREMPAGRPKVITRWTSWDKAEQFWAFTEEKIDEGQQVFVVCPAIEESERMPELPSAEQTFADLKQGPLANKRLALLHGQMHSDEKTGVMNRFAEGGYDLVVSTTVIEVGIDVPNATVMVVLGADRFGLAQLHQLRGRVGRGEHKSYCVLVTGRAVSPLAERRLRALEATRDGFQLAEEDLRLRGPGEILGQRQSGLWAFQVADRERDLWLLEAARDDASRIVMDDPSLKQPEHRPLAARLLDLRDAILRG